MREIGDSKYAFRTMSGITKGAREKDVDPLSVRKHIESLLSKGLIGRTLGKSGGERWFVTEAGRRRLLA